MSTLLLTHPACLDHEAGPHHPECPDRLRAVMARLGDPVFAALIRAEAPLATREQIARAHDGAYLDALFDRLPVDGYVRIDADTIANAGTREAMLRAAGAACAAVDAVIERRAGNAFCAVRPPGHHAESDRAMGFCFVNNAAVAARHAQAVHGLKRVAIIDFDVHHGNGSQQIFEHDASVFYASTHQWPLYPGTGGRAERGVGNIVNVPLPSGTSGADFRHAYGELILPRLADFMPDLIIVSAGFDGHRDDPLASFALGEADFVWVTRELVRAAETNCDGRLISVLEGGYDLRALADSTAAHVGALMAA